MLPLLLDRDIVINMSIVVFNDMRSSSCVGLACIVLGVKGMMVARNLYVIGAGPNCGKTVITLGLMEILSSRLDNIGFFRPLVNVRPGSKETDRDIDLIVSHFDLDISNDKTFGYTNAVANTMTSLGKTNELIEGIISKYQKMADSCSIVLCEGVDPGHLSNISEFELDATLCKNLGCLVIVVIDAFEEPSDDVFGTIERISESLRDRGCDVIAFFINRASEQQEEVLLSAIRLHEHLNHNIFHFLPNDVSLCRPTLNHVVEEFEADVLAGKSHLNRHVHDIVIGASHVDNLIRQVKHGVLVVTSGDRIDVLLGSIASVHSRNLGSISGIVLTNAITPDGAVKNLIEGMDDIVPILSLKSQN
jgi:phosphate acetyltransferase